MFPWTATEHVIFQVVQAMMDAAVVLVLVDGPEGLT